MKRALKTHSRVLSQDAAMLIQYIASLELRYKLIRPSRYNMFSDEALDAFRSALGDDDFDPFSHKLEGNQSIKR